MCQTCGVCRVCCSDKSTIPSPTCVHVPFPTPCPPFSSCLNSRLATSLGNLYVIVGDSGNHPRPSFASSSPPASPSYPVPRATFANISAFAKHSFLSEVNNNNSDQYSASNANSKISAFSNHNRSSLGAASSAGRFGLEESGQNPVTTGLSRPSARYLSRSIPVSELLALLTNPCTRNSGISFYNSSHSPSCSVSSLSRCNLSNFTYAFIYAWIKGMVWRNCIFVRLYVYIISSI